MKTVQNDESIIIKEADKVGTTVIMDKEHYRELLHSIINDNEYYETLPRDPHKDIGQKYNNFLKKHQDS